MGEEKRTTIEDVLKDIKEMLIKQGDPVLCEDRCTASPKHLGCLKYWHAEFRIRSSMIYFGLYGSHESGIAQIIRSFVQARTAEKLEEIVDWANEDALEDALSRFRAEREDDLMHDWDNLEKPWMEL